jgi:hypothetical protein
MPSTPELTKESINMNYITLKTKQQQFIRNLYTGCVLDAENEGVNLTILEAYPRQYLKMMSAKYCDVAWAPAWIVKDKSRQRAGGSYAVPELMEYHEMACEGEVDENEPAIELEEVTA